MSKVTAPLLGFGASGQIGKTQVYSTWRGVPYARRHVIPGNPKTTEQTKTRSVFKFLTASWKLATSDFQLAWKAFAKGRPFTDRNAYIGQNTAALRAGTDLTAFVFSPGANGGLAPASISVAGSSGTVTPTVGAPSLPIGWSITKCIAAAIKAGDPHTSTSYHVYSANDASAPYAPAITLPAGSYEVGAWFEFMKPDGTLAYGPALQGTGTAS